jgi:hypothetical protein
MRFGKHRGKTLAQVSTFNQGYINWIYREHYKSLHPTHPIKRALLEWSTDTKTNAFPLLATAPSRFKEGNRAIFMSQRFLRKHWNVSADELEEAGVRCMDSVSSKSGAKKFALWHVYLFATREGRKTKEAADAKVVEEADRTQRLRNGYATYRDGGYSGGGGMDMEDMYFY